MVAVVQRAFADLDVRTRLDTAVTAGPTLLACAVVALVAAGVVVRGPPGRPRVAGRRSTPGGPGSGRVELTRDRPDLAVEGAPVLVTGP